MLQTAWDDHTEGAIHNVAMRIDCHANTEKVVAIARVAIEPGAIVDIAITRAGVGQWFRSLVNRKVVERVEHRVTLWLRSVNIKASR